MIIPDCFGKLKSFASETNAALSKLYPDFFGVRPETGEDRHPRTPLKAEKIIHDGVWGTHTFQWQELAIIDSPILQRLRDLHQTGLAHLVYPSGRHTRFEHSLGTSIVASRVFRSLRDRREKKLRQVVERVFTHRDWEDSLDALELEVRVAALLHDSGHSLFSHTSESVYSQIPLISEATSELSDFVGKDRSAGELLSFSIAQSQHLQNYVARCGGRGVFKENGAPEALSSNLDFDNISLLILGRARDPRIQFLGDIISSGFDADKLDYLIRDAKTCGISITYDLDRYLNFVDIYPEDVETKRGDLARLYQDVLGMGPDALNQQKLTTQNGIGFNRLKLPRKAITCVEQILIAKFMLFSYIYHHPKVRAAEGLIERALANDFGLLGAPKILSTEQIVNQLLTTTDSMFLARWQVPIEPGSITTEASRRIYFRLLPRVVYSLGGQIGDPEEKEALGVFISLMKSPERRKIIAELDLAIGECLCAMRPGMWGTPAEALLRTGTWVDAPRPLSFEDTEVLLPVSNPFEDRQSMNTLFPLSEWGNAYLSYVYRVRVYSYSENLALVHAAAKEALKPRLKIYDDRFYDEKVKRERPW